MSGLQLAEAVREFNAEIPIAMLTGFGKGLDNRFLSRVQIQVVIGKPFTSVELARGVRNALGVPQTVATT